MALQDEFARSGQWLFRRRSFLPLLLTPLVAFQMRDFTFPDGSHVQDTVWDLFCLAIALAGIAVRILTVGQYLRPSASHLPVARYVHPDEFESALAL